MQTFTLDISRKSVIPLLYAKQRDVGTKILIKLTDNKEKYTVPDGVTWTVWYSGASGEGNYEKIDDRLAVVVDADAGTATVELIYQMLDNPGPGEMCLVMNGADGTQLGLWNIPYCVEALPGADSKAATAYYNAFLQARKGAEDAAAQSEAAAGRAEAAAEDAKEAAKEAANKKPQDIIVNASFDTVVSDTISTGTAATSAYDIAVAISKGATVTLIDDDNRVYKYCGYRLKPNYSNAFFEAQEIDANGITTYRATINNEGQASRTKYTHEYAAAATDPDRHAEYFTITEDGVLSLKPEYRGACPSNKSTLTYAISDNGLNTNGSKNKELPKLLIVPEVVNEITVVRLPDGMFAHNEAVETIVLPEFVTEIPLRMCDYAHNLKHIYNTENVTKIGAGAFQAVSMEKAKFPKLSTMDMYAFYNCPFLKYADIGSVTNIPMYAFGGCQMLSRIKGGAEVTTVGQGALRLTSRLNSVEFLPKLTKIEKNGFFKSRIVYDWASLTNCTFGDKATAQQLNPTDIWSACTTTPVENPVPTLLSQYDPRWSNEKIGTSATLWRTGCNLFSIMHAYCALHNLTLSSVNEVEEIMNEKAPTLLASYDTDIADIKPICEALGMAVTRYQNYGQTELQAVYDALKDGKYVILSHPSAAGESLGHTVLIYGVNAKGEMLVADSSFGAAEYVGAGEMPIKYAMSYQNMTQPSIMIHIVSL